MPGGTVVPTPDVGRGAEYPQFPGTRAEGPEIDPAYIANLHLESARTMERVLRRLKESAETFDSYRPQSFGGESLTQLNILLDYELQEARTIVVTGPTVNPGASTPATGSATSVGAFTGIAATPAVPAGTYQVTATGYFTGTAPVAGVDNNNMQVTFGGQNFQIPVEAVLNQPATITFNATIPAAHTFVVQSIAAGTVGTTYNAEIIVTPITNANGTPFTLQLGGRAWQLLLPVNGLWSTRFNPGLLLKRADLNQLVSATAGNWAVEITGFRSDMT